MIFYNESVLHESQASVKSYKWSKYTKIIKKLSDDSSCLKVNICLSLFQRIWGFSPKPLERIYIDNVLKKEKGN